jgi:hypothetical protein
VFRQLVIARIIEPVSKIGSLRVLEEAGIAPPSYPALKRRLPAYAEEAWRHRLPAACAAHARLGRASLVLCDVSTLYFETDLGDGFREPGFSKERRLDPQITIGLLTDQAGFPLMVSAFEGNKAETILWNLACRYYSCLLCSASMLAILPSHRAGLKAATRRRQVHGNGWYVHYP